MYNEGFEQWLKMNRHLTGPLSDWTKASTEFCQRMTEQNLEMLNENMGRITEELKDLSNVRGPDSLLNWQKNCFNKEMTAAIENTQKLVHITMDNIQEFTKLCGTSLHEPIVAGAKQAEKAAEKFEKHSK